MPADNCLRLHNPTSLLPQMANTSDESNVEGALRGTDQQIHGRGRGREVLCCPVPWQTRRSLVGGRQGGGVGSAGHWDGCPPLQAQVEACDGATGGQASIVWVCHKPSPTGGLRPPMGSNVWVSPCLTGSSCRLKLLAICYLLPI